MTSNHRLFAKLLAHTVACDQTRVFNVMLTDGLSQLRFAGEANTQHLFTHEDPIDEKLGYQPNVVRFVPTVLGNLRDLLVELDAIREGDRTLLDRMLVLAYTDSGYAKNHTTDNIPMVTAGSAGGRLKTGIHVAAAKGDPVTRVSLTVAVGVPISSFGTESNKTSKTITVAWRRRRRDVHGVSTGGLVGAAFGALLLAARYYGHPQQPPFDAQSLIPPATPPGITLQQRVGAQKARVAAAPQWMYADSRGMTLYTYGKDTSRNSLCTGACAAAWPPALAPPEANQSADWSLINRADGTRQWAHRGAPLYKCAGDKVVGEPTGDGADGGQWHVAYFQPGAGLTLPDGIEVRDIADAGGIGLSDFSGRTLYSFDGTTADPKPSCDAGDCTRPWLPLEAPEIAGTVGAFSAIARDDGTNGSRSLSGQAAVQVCGRSEGRRYRRCRRRLPLSHRIDPAFFHARRCRLPANDRTGQYSGDPRRRDSLPARPRDHGGAASVSHRPWVARARPLVRHIDLR